MHRVPRFAVLALAFLFSTDPLAAVRAQQPEAENLAVRELFEAGEAAFSKGDYKKAIRAYSKAFEASENRSMIALYGLGKTYLRLAKFDQAEEYGKRMLELGSTDVESAAAENLIGGALLGKARDTQDESERGQLLSEAESHLRTSLEISSGQMNIAWFNLSVVLQELNRLAEAVEAQQEYLNRSPENRPAKTRLCQLQFLAPQVEKPDHQEQEREPGPHVESDQRPRRVTAEVLPPEKLQAPPPKYTQPARDSRIEGVVIIEAIIDTAGDVTNVKVLKGLPLGLDKEAALGVCQWQFKPATLNGKPVAVIYNLTVNFRLK